MDHNLSQKKGAAALKKKKEGGNHLSCHHELEAGPGIRRRKKTLPSSKKKEKTSASISCRVYNARASGSPSETHFDLRSGMLLPMGRKFMRKEATSNPRQRTEG